MFKLKNLTKLIAIIFLLVFSLNALVAIPAQAQLKSGEADGWDEKLETTAGAGGYETPTETTSLGTIVGNIIKIVLGVLGLILLIMIIYGGFLWMTSAGDEEKVSKAKKLIGNAVIGVLIVVLAYTITYFVMDKLTTGITDTGEIMD